MNIENYTADCILETNRNYGITQKDLIKIAHKDYFNRVEDAIEKFRSAFFMTNDGYQVFVDFGNRKSNFANEDLTTYKLEVINDCEVSKEYKKQKYEAARNNYLKSRDAQASNDNTVAPGIMAGLQCPSSWDELKSTAETCYELAETFFNNLTTNLSESYQQALKYVQKLKEE